MGSEATNKELIAAKLPGSGNKEIRLKIEYTARRNFKRVSFYKSDGTLFTSRLGYSQILFSYDDKFRLSGTRYLDADSNIVR